MARPKEITKILKAADKELAAFVTGLEKENLKLHDRIAKMLAETVSKDNQIKSLKKELDKELRQSKLIINTIQRFSSKEQK